MRNPNTHSQYVKNLNHFKNSIITENHSFAGMIVLFLVITSSYVWFVVYSTYKSLETKKGLTHVLHGVKKKSVVPVVQKSKAVQADANKPYEV